MEVCKAKKKNRSVQRNWVQEAESNEDKVFSVYHQRDIGGKIAPYVANMKIENEIVALEIGTGASVSILNKKIYDLICFNLSVNLLVISSKLKCYSGELTHPLGKIVCKVT